MNSLLGDRFLKRFAGEIRRKLKHPTFEEEGQKPDAGDEMVISPENNAADEIRGTETADSQETRQGTKA